MPGKLTLKRHWLVRYGGALATVGAGLLLRLGLTAMVGEGLPTYITFYPVIMAVALLGGCGPGLLATIATALTVDYWLLPPTGAFGIASVVDAVGLAFFLGMGVFMSVVAELYRRARQKAAAHDTDFLRHEGQETPRQAIGENVLLVGGLVLALVILAAVGWQAYRNLAATAQADRWVSHTCVVDDELEHLYSTLENMEASERSYLIMGEEDYLRPYSMAQRTVAGHIASLKRLTADNPDQVQRLTALEALVDAKLAELKEVIEVRRSQGLEAAHALMASGKGQALTEEIRKGVTEAEDEEQRLLQARTTAKDADLRKTLQAVLAGGLLSVVLLTTVFLFLTQENKRRRKAEAGLRRHQEGLQEIVLARTADLSRANESLSQQCEWLKVTLTSIGDCVLATDTAGHITFLNPIAASLTGWAEKEALGQPIQQVFRVINEDTRAPSEDIVARVLREGRVVALANHTALLTRDGREVPIEDSAAPIKDSAGTVSGVVLVFHDVTEKRRAQAAMRESQRQNEFLATIIERASQPFAVGYPDGRLGLLNPAFEELTGYTAQELHSMSWANTLTPPEWREVERRNLEELARTGQPVRYEKEYMRKDGRRVPIELLVHLARDAKGELEYYYSFLTDITGRKQADQAMRDLNDQLQRHVAELQASRRAALSLAEDATEARKEAERVNTDLQTANASLDASRKAAVNLMEDALRARRHAEAVSAELRQNQERLLRLGRVLKALKDSSLAMVRSTSEAEYLAEVCKIVVQDCGHAMVWFGFAEDDAEKSVRPAAYSGFEQGYLETLRITWADTDLGRGPTGSAIRIGQPGICRDTLTDPALAPWRAEAVKRGYASSIAVPLLAGGRAFGAITIYAKEPDAFSEDEVKLLTQLADDVSFCLRTLRLQVAKAQADLERDKFVSLAENSTVFIAMCGRDFIPFYVNESGLRLVGLDSLARACRIPFSEFFFPEDRKRMLEEFLPFALQTGRAEVEVRFRHFKTGRPLWMLYNVFHIKDAGGKPIGLGIVGRNITDRKQAERRTELLAETASQLLASDSPQLVVEDLCHRVLDFLECQVFFNFLVDEQTGARLSSGAAASARPGALEGANARPPAAPEDERTPRLHLNAYAGISAEDAKRLEWRDLETAICGLAALDAHRIVAEDIQQSHDLRTEMVKAFGIQAYAVYPLIAQGRVLGTLSFGTRTRTHFTRAEMSLMKAVADQVAIAMERQRAQTALRQTAEELKRSNLDLEQFAYVASHDLQEPLRAVGGYVRLLERNLSKSLDARTREFMTGAIDGAVRMERLIEDLLAYSRIGARGREFAPAELDALLGQALDNLRESIVSARASVTREPLPRVAVDSTQIMQVFQNLVGNALKFRGEAPPAIHVGACHEDGRWVISVRDNGIGIDPEYFGKIFQLFQRLHTRKQYPGTGIGLTICKRIIERHGGTIWVESQPGKGATFYFSIPIAKG
jgi:PAS domain S-box-containing protein